MNKFFKVVFFALLLVVTANVAEAQQSGGSGSSAGGGLQAEYSAPGIVAEGATPEMLANTKAGGKSMEEIKTIREQNMARMEELKKKAETLRDKAKMQAQKQRIMGREVALGRFDNAVDKLENNKKLISDSLPKIEALGIDTTNAKTKLAEVDAKILKAKELVAEMQGLLASTAENLSKETKETLNAKAKETQAVIKEAHSSLVTLVRELKALTNQKRIEARNNAGMPKQ